MRDFNPMLQADNEDSEEYGRTFDTLWDEEFYQELNKTWNPENQE